MSGRETPRSYFADQRGDLYRGFGHQVGLMPELSAITGGPFGIEQRFSDPFSGSFSQQEPLQTASQNDEAANPMLSNWSSNYSNYMSTSVGAPDAYSSTQPSVVDTSRAIQGFSAYSPSIIDAFGVTTDHEQPARSMIAVEQPNTSLQDWRSSYSVVASPPERYEQQEHPIIDTMSVSAAAATLPGTSLATVSGQRSGPLCHECGEHFVRKSDRDRHVNNQHGDAKVLCGILGCEYSRPRTGRYGLRADKLKEHMRTKHPNARGCYPAS